MFGVARDETVRISCEVVANPIGSTTFEWRFNASGEMVDMPNDRYAIFGQKFLENSKISVPFVDFNPLPRLQSSNTFPEPSWITVPCFAGPGTPLGDKRILACST